jgi:hypothetical protein
MPLSLNGSGGITYPDGTVNATRSASTAGDTFTGQVNINTAGFALRTTGANFSGMSMRATGTGGREYVVSTTDNSNGLGGGLFNIYDQTAGQNRLSIDSAGRVTKPGQPAFCATAAYGSAHVGNLSPIVFANIDINRGNHYNTSNGIFTAPTAGAYYFITQAHLGNNTGYATIRILQNAGIVSNSWSGNTADSGWNSLSASVILNLAANDTVRVQMETTKPTNYIAETYWKFMGYLIG